MDTDGDQKLQLAASVSPARLAGFGKPHFNEFYLHSLSVMFQYSPDLMEYWGHWLLLSATGCHFPVICYV